MTFRNRKSYVPVTVNRKTLAAQFVAEPSAGRLLAAFFQQRQYGTPPLDPLVRDLA